MSTDSTPATIETVIEQSLVTLDMGIAPMADKFGKDYRALHAEYLNRLAAEVEALPEITDRKSYEVNQKQRTRLVSIRTGLDKTRKALFEPMRRLKEEVDEYIGTNASSGLQARLKAMEEAIATKQQAWDAEQERIRQEALRIIEERNASRNRILLDAGMAFDGAAFTLRALKVYQRDIHALKDDAFEAWCSEVLAPVQAEKAEADRIEAEAKAAKEAEAEAARQEMERRQREQDERERKAEQERRAMEAERDALRKEKRDHLITVRCQKLQAMGLVMDPAAQMMKLLVDAGDEPKGIGVEWQLYGFDQIGDADEEEWAAIVTGIEAKIEQLRAEASIAAIGASRLVSLKGIGAQEEDDGEWTLGRARAHQHSLGTMSDEQWGATRLEFEREAQWVKEREAELASRPFPEPEAAPEYDMEELLACSLSLLDEANKAFTTLGNVERYSATLAALQGHAAECVQLARSLQS